MKVTERIKKLFYKTKKYHWYQVRFIYKKNGKEIFNYAQEIGLTDRKTILNKRTIKKIETPLHKSDDSIKRIINNGIFTFEVICYLGYLEKP